MNGCQYLFFALLLSICPLSYIDAQNDQFNLLTLQSEGEIPQDFQENSHHIDSLKVNTLFSSGLVIYGTKYNHYIQSIIDRLLDKNLQWKDKIRVYLYRSSEINIYSTNDGIIFINIGLLTNLTNESELAFVLAHEISHIVNVHPHDYDQFSHKERSLYLDLKNKDHNRSSDDDLEADQFGYEHFFLAAGYTTSDITAIFHHLDSPKNLKINFNSFKSILTNNQIQWSEDYFNDDNPEDNSNDIQLEKSLQNRNKEKEKWFKTDSSTPQNPNQLFIDLIHWSRFELLGLYLIEHDYNNSFFYNLFLIEQYPDDPMLDMAWLASNFGYYRLKSTVKKYELSDDDQLSESHKNIHYFFNKISIEELKQYTFSVAKKLTNSYPENKYVAKVMNYFNNTMSNGSSEISPENLIIFQPQYFKINKNREIVKDKTDDLQNTISSIFTALHIAKANNPYFTTPTFTTASYNYYAQLQLMKYEIASQLDSQLVYHQLLNLSEYSKIMDFKYINLITVNYRSVPDRFITRFYYAPLIALTPPSFPFTLAHIFANRKKIEAQFVIVNVQSGNLVFFNSLNISDFNGKPILKQFLYDNYKTVLQP